MVIRVSENHNKLIIHSEDSSEIWAYCPFHNDKQTPNLLISKVGGYAGYYKCFACGKFGKAKDLGIDVESKVVKKLNNATKYTPINWTKLSAEYEYTASEDFRYTPLMIDWGVSKNVLKRLRMGWSAIEECYTFPMCNSMFAITGIQRRFTNQNKEKKAISGSKLGCFVPIDIDFTDIIIICEGVHDTATILDLGFQAIGRPGASSVYQLTADIVSGCNVLIIPDNDAPGKDGAKRLYKELKPVCDRVVVLDTSKFGVCKDISEYIDYNSKESVRNILKSIICNLKANILET